MIMLICMLLHITHYVYVQFQSEQDQTLFRGLLTAEKKGTHLFIFIH